MHAMPTSAYGCQTLHVHLSLSAGSVACGDCGQPHAHIRRRQKLQALLMMCRHQS